MLRLGPPFAAEAQALIPMYVASVSLNTVELISRLQQKAHEKQLIDASQALINSAASTGAITLDESKRLWNAVDERGIPPVSHTP